MSVKKKSIVLFKCTDRSERDELMKQYAEKYPQFSVYANTLQNRRTYHKTYQIKASGSVEEIEKYLESQKKAEHSYIQAWVDLLMREMEPLRLMYQEKMKEWGELEFIRCEEVAGMSYEQLIDRFGQEYNGGRKYISKRDDAHIQNAKRVYSMGIEAFLEQVRKDAEEHYEYSIIRLAGRVEGKGLKFDELRVKTEVSRINVNIETVLTDGEKLVKAWTIIAFGPVQRPHYRYLVK